MFNLLNENEVMSTFQDRLVEAMHEKRVKQVQIKDAVNVSKGTVSNWVSGKTNPDGVSILKIAKFLNISVDWLATGEGEMNPNTQSTTTAEVQPPINNDEPEIKLTMDALKKFLNSNEGFLIEKFRSLSTENQQAVITIISGIEDKTVTNNKTVN
ncbi:MAG: helix-turn-helix domain-containing protein, partial [Moraxellaceae bacterium]|nr:helix-turn-helix domain-containing protein [Moraxellaceae bacterium]